MVTLTRIEGNFSTQVEPAKYFAPRDQAVVDGVWRRALRVAESLHDGRILTVSSISRTEIVVSPVAYRYWYAQFTAGVPLGIRPLAVTGVLRLANGFLMGQRSRALLEDGGLWEFAPSGGVQAPTDEATGVVDPHAQVVVEAREELNINASDLGHGEPLAIIENEITRVVDLVYMYRPAIDIETIRGRAAGARDREYTELEEVCAPWRVLGPERLSACARAIATELDLNQT